MKMLSQTSPRSWMSLEMRLLTVFLLLATCLTSQAYSQTTAPRSKKNTTPTGVKQTASSQPVIAAKSRSQPTTKQVTDPEATAKDFSGTWKLKNNKKLTDQRTAAVEQVISAMPRFQQGYARKLLTKKTSPPSVLKIADAGSQIQLEHSGLRITIATNGKAVNVKTDEGVASLQAGKQDGKLIILSKSPKATLTKVFSLSADGKTLTQQVHIQSKKFSTPIQFSNQFQQ